MQSAEMGTTIPTRPTDARKHAIYFNGYDGRPEKEYQSRVEPEHQDGTRIDTILRKYGTSGVDRRSVGLFQQMTATLPFGVQPDTDYQKHLNQIVQVQNYFANLPSSLRDFFQNEPSNMLAFMADPKNAEKCREFGLAPKLPETPGSARDPEKKANADTTTATPSKTETPKT